MKYFLFEMMKIINKKMSKQKRIEMFEILFHLIIHSSFKVFKYIKHRLMNFTSSDLKKYRLYSIELELVRCKNSGMKNCAQSTFQMLHDG